RWHTLWMPCAGTCTTPLRGHEPRDDWGVRTVRVLLAGVDERTGAVLQTILELDGNEVMVEPNRWAVAWQTRERRPQVVLLDTTEVGELAPGVVRRVSSAGPAVVVLSADSDDITELRLRRAGAIAFVVKPVDALDVARVVET